MTVLGYIYLAAGSLLGGTLAGYLMGCSLNRSVPIVCGSCFGTREEVFIRTDVTGYEVIPCRKCGKRK